MYIARYGPTVLLCREIQFGLGTLRGSQSMANEYGGVTMRGSQRFAGTGYIAMRSLSGTNALPLSENTPIGHLFRRD